MSDEPEKRALLLARVVSSGLFGNLAEDLGDFVVFERVPLLIAKSEESAARSGMAKWDDGAKGWFAIEESDVGALAGWMPDYAAIGFCLAINRQQCWKCSRNTSVFCIAARDGYLAQDLLYEDEASGKVDSVVWTPINTGTFIGNLTLLNGSVRRLLAERCPTYRIDFSRTAESSYFMNHCEYCDATLGDFYMHNEPGGAFFPTTEDEARQIELWRVDLPLLAQGSAAFTSPDLTHFCTYIDASSDHD